MGRTSAPRVIAPREAEQRQTRSSRHAITIHHGQPPELVGLEDVAARSQASCGAPLIGGQRCEWCEHLPRPIAGSGRGRIEPTVDACCPIDRALRR